jgi:hypothetical protein
MNDPLRQLWTTQESDAHGFDPAALDRRARMFHRRIMRRDAIEYAASALVVVIFGGIAFATPEWSLRIACLLIIAGIIVVVRNLWTRRMPAPPEALGTAGLDYYRTELVRQRDSLASVERWYIAPMVPGMVAFLMASGWIAARTTPLWLALASTAVTLAFVTGVAWVIRRLNHIAARRLDREIRDIDVQR